MSGRGGRFVSDLTIIDIDEKIIPDEVTVSGTLLGLLLVTMLPQVLLPDLTEDPGPPAVAAPRVDSQQMHLPGPSGVPLSAAGSGSLATSRRPSASRAPSPGRASSRTK